MPTRLLILSISAGACVTEPPGVAQVRRGEVTYVHVLVNAATQV